MSITPPTAGSFKWAMEKVHAGERVRRRDWPREGRRKWHLFLMAEFETLEFWRSGIINGWGGQAGGAADDDPMRDGMLYTPTPDDEQAADWETL